MERPNALWYFDNSGSAYVDKTDNTADNTAITFIDDANDTWYIGCDGRFVGLLTTLSTNGSYSGLSFSYYSGGNTWKKLQLIDTYSFSESKYLRWNLPNGWVRCNFTDSYPHDGYSPPDSVERYWIKITATAVTTAAIMSEFRILPYTTYAKSSDISDYMQLPNKFTLSTTPAETAVEDIIARIESRIDYQTKKSWKFNVVTEDTDPVLVDYNRYGLYLRYRNFFKVYSVQIWTGSEWKTLTEGRQNDYFVNYNTGMIYFTRLWLLPATYGMTGRYFHWGFGEFKNSVKISYAYGRDKETDPEYKAAEGITVKLAAVEVLKHMDWSAMAVSGVDKVSIESKVRLNAENAEDELESLSGVVLY